MQRECGYARSRNWATPKGKRETSSTLARDRNWSLPPHGYNRESAKRPRVQMKVSRIHECGGSDVIRYEDAPVPSPKANEVLVKVHACSLNHLDL